MYHDAAHMRYVIACLASAWLAYAFLARVLRTARARLDRVLSKMGQASLRSYKWGSISGTARYPSEPTYLSPGRSARLFAQFVVGTLQPDVGRRSRLNPGGSTHRNLSNKLFRRGDSFRCV